MSTGNRSAAPLPTISEQVAAQLGGWRGAVETTVPIVAFIAVNAGLEPLAKAFGWDAGLTGALGAKYDLKVAVSIAVLVAVGIAARRLAQKRTVRHSVNGLVGVGLGAWLAWRSGEARDFYLPGIWYGLAYGVVLLATAASRWPLVGWIWSVMADGGKHDWRDSPRLMRTFRWLTLVWGTVWLIKVGIQLVFYQLGSEAGLAITRLVFGYPPYLVLLLLTMWAVRRVKAAEAAAEPIPAPRV
ncbi:hypothetical protein GCM10010123_04730 [Pilimelia anulata]|uniref:DUF3159 domain-containing protein n=1 Tax=Pilimelia anulata TaxID=53371 RepID=A0A8J3F7E5_9ACTN|nr:DUF3159 domain-containing protein [Pilimelia anulata]GGJ77732.1 hypothetical protein GCM10010123_04730 [Pilimelia anulata]